MDALPIQEETGLDFASANAGVMHACGHDAHVAMLLGTAALLQARRDQLRRPVKLIFQPHEEYYPGGSSAMIAAGVLDGVESVFALHIWSPLPCGVLGVRSGPSMSSVNDFQITIKGKGGHAALPEASVDPVVAAADVILALQTVVSRSISMTDNAVVSVTTVRSGTANNIIPETVVLRGTIRALSESVRTHVCQRVCELCTDIARAHRAVAEPEILPGYPVLVNDESVVERATRAAKSVGVGDDQIRITDPIGGGEDFAYYAQKVPAALAFLGAGNDSIDCCYPHHHPRFNIDEEALPVGSAILAQYALDRSAK